MVTFFSSYEPIELLYLKSYGCSLPRWSEQPCSFILSHISIHVLQVLQIPGQFSRSVNKTVTQHVYRNTAELSIQFHLILILSVSLFAIEAARLYLSEEFEKFQSTFTSP
jgi:hypothetical protein